MFVSGGTVNPGGLEYKRKKFASLYSPGHPGGGEERDNLKRHFKAEWLEITIFGEEESCFESEERRGDASSGGRI